MVTFRLRVGNQKVTSLFDAAVIRIVSKRALSTGEAPN
jgi:hypothetical protein